MWLSSCSKRVVMIAGASVTVTSRPPHRAGGRPEPHRLLRSAGHGVAGPPLGGDRLAHSGQGAVLGHLVGATAGAEVVEQGVDVVVGDLVEVAVVHLQAGRLGAGRDALDVLEGEGAVGGGAAGLDAEAVLEVVEQLLAADEHAGDVGAHVDEVVADGLALEHLVERAGAEHLGRRDADQLGDVLHGVVGDVAVLLLRQVQERDQRRLGPRVPSDDLGGNAEVRSREASHQRSTSPMIGSTDEIAATASAIRPPRIMWGRVWRFTKLGPRMCMR